MNKNQKIVTTVFVFVLLLVIPLYIAMSNIRPDGAWIENAELENEQASHVVFADGLIFKQEAHISDRDTLYLVGTYNSRDKKYWMTSRYSEKTEEEVAYFVPGIRNGAVHYTDGGTTEFRREFDEEADRLLEKALSLSEEIKRENPDLPYRYIERRQ